MALTELSQAQYGQLYRVVPHDTGLNGVVPALEIVEGRGRPRGLTGDSLTAARALRGLGKTLEDIASMLDTSVGAVRSALGAPR